jgi:cephalosporin hydroxylase
MIDILQKEYEYVVALHSDIVEHLPILKQYADQCNTVVEFGTRTGISTRALLASNAKTVCAYDLEIDLRVLELFKIAVAEKNVIYQKADSRYIDILQTDLLFIDTDHTYSLLTEELRTHHRKVNKYIAFHDTHAYGLNKDDETDPGLLPAIFEFMRDFPEWQVDYFTTRNNGFLVLKKVN